MAKYILKDTLHIVKIGDVMFVTKRFANNTTIKVIQVSKTNINSLIEDGIIKQVEDIVKIDYNTIKKVIEKNVKPIEKKKLIRKIAIEIDKCYNDNISEQVVWFYVDESKIKRFYSNTNFNYYNGNGYGLFRNLTEAYFAKNLADSILNGK